MGVEALPELADVALEPDVLAEKLGDLVDGVEGSGVIAPAAVSYTHLDVYKRQQR